MTVTNQSNAQSLTFSALPGWFIIVETGRLTWNHPKCVLEKIYNLRPNWKLVPEPLQPPFLIRCRSPFQTPFWGPKMKPVSQTKFGIGVGNCWEACIASILEIELDSIPNIVGAKRIETVIQWLLDEHKVALLFVEICNEDGIHYPFVPRDQYYIVGGMSKIDRGIGISQVGPHAVVGYGNEIVHNPGKSKMICMNAIHLLIPMVECTILPLKPYGTRQTEMMAIEGDGESI